MGVTAALVRLAVVIFAGTMEFSGIKTIQDLCMNNKNYLYFHTKCHHFSGNRKTDGLTFAFLIL